MKITLPGNVKNIIRILQDAGYEAYAVGGCVRDSLLNRTPDDWDITTNASPVQVKELFHRTIDTGIRHGTVTVMLNRIGYEVTTYRIDGEYEDGRHPKDVTFTASLKEDLCRRDFTINAMAYNDEDGLVDCFGGLKDLEAGIVRCVGDPLARFTEDALRMMRAVRFSAQLGFTIEEATLKAISQLAERLKKISAERIQTELVKLLMSPHPDYLKILYDTGVTKIILPEFDACMETPQNNPHHCYSVGEHILHTLKACEPERVLRLTMLFHDIGKPRTKTADEKGIDHFHGHAAVSERMAHDILKRLRFDTDTIVMTGRLIKNHDRKIESNRRGMRRAMAAIGADLFPALFAVKEADIAGQSDYKKEDKYAELCKLREAYAQVLAGKDCVTLKDLAVDGKDLIEAGIAPGPDVGMVLKRLLEIVVEEPEKNNREYLLTHLDD